MTHRPGDHGGKARRQGLALWFLLLSILTHAVVPVGSPLQLSSGSAFGATTAEVAIATERTSADVERADPGGGDPAGAAGGDHPALLPGNAPFRPVMAASRRAPSAGPASAVAAVGGAAPFSARAPPSI